MDADVLKRKLDAARDFTVSHGGIELKVRLPTETAMRAAVARLPESGHERLAELQRSLMMQCVVGWSGLTPGSLLPDAGDDPLPFSPDLLDDVFDRWPKLYDDAYLALMERYNARIERLEAERKN